MKNIIFIIIFTGVSIISNAQTLEEYLVMGAENNPSLRSSFSHYNASLQRVAQAGALPDPQLSMGIFLEPMPRFIGNQVAEFSVMQMFPWFGTLGAAENEAALMAKARYESFNELKSTINYEIKSTWYALYLLQKEIDITEENIEILKTLEQIVINRYKTGSSKESNSSAAPMRQERQTSPSGSSSSMNNMGMGNPGSTQTSASSTNMNAGMTEMNTGSSMVDVIRIQIEINELNNSLIILNNNLHHLLIRFNELLNRDLNNKIAIPDTMTPLELPLSISQMQDSIRKNNPMLLMLAREEEAYMAQARMNRKMSFPMIGLGLQYSVFQPRPGSESMMNGRNMLMPMVTVGIPLWRKKYTASVREADFSREGTVEQRRNAENELMVGYEETIVDYQNAQRSIEFYQQQLNLSQQALNILTVQYTTSGSNFEEVLRMQQQLLSYKLSILDAVVDLNVAVAMIERLMGR